MKYWVGKMDPNYDFEVTGVSFIGEPENGTVLFVTRKLRSQMENLRGKTGCLIFAEQGIDIPEELREKNCILVSADPMGEYGRFAMEAKAQEKAEQADRKMTLTQGGYYLGENVKLGEGVTIEPGCLIGHDVEIGAGSHIGFGSVIRHARIGNRFRCGAHTEIGTAAYFPVGDGEEGLRIPSFGKVFIGNDADFGGNVIIERGFNANTMIGDHVIFDAGVCIGHDDRIGNGVWILCGSCLGGFVTVGDDAYIGMNATVKQRLSIGERARIGMGAVVITRVKADTKVFGNPATRTE